MRNEDLDRVVPLDQLDDFRVASGDPDVRGWEVVGSDGGKIGEVDELLVDTRAMKVRYLDVDLDLDDGAPSGDPGRHVLVPIGYARLDREHDRVIVDELAAADLRALPSYEHGPITRDFEASVRDTFPRVRGGVTADGGDQDTVRAGGGGPTSGGRMAGPAGDAGAVAGALMASGDPADDFYAHEGFDEDRFWAARRSTGLGGALGSIGRDVEPGAGGLGNSDPTLRRGVDEPGGMGNSDPRLRDERR
jgi:sporulation protein YlmC with PRC-barrel domain